MKLFLKLQFDLESGEETGTTNKSGYKRSKSNKEPPFSEPFLGICMRCTPEDYLLSKVQV